MYFTSHEFTTLYVGTHTLDLDYVELMQDAARTYSSALRLASLC